MKRIFALLVGVVPAMLASAASANTLTPIHDLVASPQTFDRQTITIAGTVASVVDVGSASGMVDEPHEMLVVCDGRSCVLAKLAAGNFPDMRGAHVNLRGIFSATKRIGSEIVPQQIATDLFTLE
jgi:hypothetical protein